MDIRAGEDKILRSDVREAFAHAVRLHQSGRLGEAETLYRQILQADPGHSDALHFLGVLAHQAGRHEAAVELIGKAIAHNGRVPSFHNNLGSALRALGRREEAVFAFGRALACAPDHAGAHYNLGVTLQDLGRREEAAGSYRRALAALPGHPDALLNHGNLLALAGCLSEASAAYRRALCLRPDHAATLAALGLTRLRLARIEEAQAYCHAAILADPGLAGAYGALGNALAELGRRDEAMASCRRAVILDPDASDARLALAIAAIPVAPATESESAGAARAFTAALADLEAWNEAHPGRLGTAIGSVQPFHLAYRPHDVGPALSRYGALAASAAADCRPLDPPPRRSGGKLRLGVVSGQMRAAHPVWDVLLRGILAHLDRDRFELFLYHTGQTADGETAWAGSRATRFVQGPLPAEGWIAEIRRDRPDILFYPEVGMDPVTGLLAALRLAPVQAASWGHPVTTGLPTIDLFFSGELLEGADADGHYRERLIRLPGTGACTEIAPIRRADWNEAGQRTGAVRFALCQQPTKFDPVDDRLLVRIAQQAGPCEFWIAASRTHPWATDRLMTRLADLFRREGLDPDAHLRRFSWLDRERFSGFLAAMDVYLDCPAFSGYTTAWQAVHQGLPIVTLEGRFLRQRLAAGLLRQIGQVDGIAATGDAYVDAALRLARQDRVALAEAAPRADGDRRAVAAFAETLIAALG